MKELKLTRTITDFTAQDYYQAIYATERAFQRYHQEESKDPEAKVTAWTPSGGDGQEDRLQRQVHFQLALNVPQMLKKVIGADSIGVVETQSILWHGKDKFVVTSAPSLNFPGSNKFETKGHTTVQTTADGRTCEIEAVIECNAAMPWPMQGTVEAAMATEAQAGVTKFLDFCKKQCEALKAQRLLQQPAVPSAAPPPAAAAAAAEVVLAPGVPPEEGGEVDFYYDALDEAQQDSFNNLAGLPATTAGTRLGRPAYAAGGVGRGVAAVGGRAAAGAGGSAQEVLTLAALREMQVNSHSTAQALADVAEQLRQLNDNVLAIRAAVAGSIPPQGVAGARGAAGGAWGRSGSSTSSAGLVLLGVLAGVSACGLVYLRTQAGRGGGGGGGGLLRWN